MSEKLKLWLYGLLVAVVSAIGDAGTAYLGAMVFAPSLINEGLWKALAGMVVFSAAKTVFAYLKQSPLPKPDGA